MGKLREFELWSVPWQEHVKEEKMLPAFAFCQVISCAVAWSSRRIWGFSSQSCRCCRSHFGSSADAATGSVRGAGCLALSFYCLAQALWWARMALRKQIGQLPDQVTLCQQEQQIKVAAQIKDLKH
eukprot:2225463-Amphidinium_carterae.1